MAYAREYSRSAILKKNLQFEEGWVKLNYSTHALDRLKERLKGNITLYPKEINVSKLNIYKGYSYDGVHLHKVIIRLEFKKDEWVFLVILPKEKLVKTLWFADKKGNRKAVGVFSENLERTSRGEDLSILREEDIWSPEAPLLRPSTGEEQVPPSHL